MKSLHARDNRRYPVAPLCALLGVSKQAFYKYDEAKSLFKNLLITNALKFIMEVRSIDPGIGGMKLWHLYEQERKGEVSQQVCGRVIPGKQHS